MTTKAPTKAYYSQTEAVANVTASVKGGLSIEPNSKPDKLFYIETLRCIAIIQVLLVHASGPFAVSTYSPTLFWTGLITDSFARSCVPLFLMISGMLLLSSEKEESISSFLKRRLTRVIVPLVVWTAVFTTWNTYNGMPFNWLDVLNKPACYHLSYLYYLTGLYLATPVLKAFLKGAKQQEISYFLVLWFIGTSMPPAIAVLTGVNIPILFAVATGFSGYFVLGYALRDVKIPTGKFLYAAFALLACLCATIFGTAALTFAHADKKLDESFFTYLSPQIIAYSTLIFVMVKSANLEVKGILGQTLKRMVKALSAASFTIYLVHPLFLDTVVNQLRWMVDSGIHRSVMTICVLASITVVTLLISWAFYLICRLIRVPTWLVP